jgi:integrase
MEGFNLIGAFMKKLYVKIDDEFHELDALLVGSSLKEIKKTLIRDAIDKYIECCTKLKCIKNQNNEKLGFEWFESYLKDNKVKFINEVNREHIDKYEVLLLKRMKASSVNRRFCTIKNFFRKCHEWNLIHENPCVGKSKIRVEPNRRMPWTEEMFNKFILTCDKIHYSIFAFLWFSGCRPMELKNLKWTDIDYDNKTITLACGKNSNIKRHFPLTPVLDQILHTIKADSIYVFSDNKKQISNDCLYHYCVRRLKALGYKNYSVYGIRHGFGSRLARQGVNSFYIAELMGHSRLDTTKQYVHTDKKLLQHILSGGK